MNDFEAPQLKDTAPPRVFNTIRASDVAYNADFVTYLFQQEFNRRIENKQPPMTLEQAREFYLALTSLVIVHRNVEAAIVLRPV